jgi:hypothetical protein
VLEPTGGKAHIDEMRTIIIKGIESKGKSVFKNIEDAWYYMIGFDPTAAPVYGAAFSTLKPVLNLNQFGKVLFGPSIEGNIQIPYDQSQPWEDLFKYISKGNDEISYEQFTFFFSEGTMAEAAAAAAAAPSGFGKLGDGKHGPDAVREDRWAEIDKVKEATEQQARYQQIYDYLVHEQMEHPSAVEYAEKYSRIGSTDAKEIFDQIVAEEAQKRRTAEIAAANEHATALQNAQQQQYAQQQQQYAQQYAQPLTVAQSWQALQAYQENARQMDNLSQLSDEEKWARLSDEDKRRAWAEAQANAKKPGFLEPINSDEPDEYGRMSNARGWRTHDSVIRNQYEEQEQIKRLKNKPWEADWKETGLGYAD